MSENSYHAIFNANAGTALANGITAEDLRSGLSQAGLEGTIDDDTSRPLEARLEDARRSPARTLIAAGGDGTATALATIALETNRPLAVLPLGTANLLARDLGLPLTPEEWFESFGSNVTRRIDVGEVNGELFLHNVSVGAFPGLAAAREHMRGRPGLSATLGFLAHLARRLSRLRRFAAEVTPAGQEPHIELVQSLTVANNRYDEAPGAIFTRSRLDRGALGLYLIRHLGVGDAVRLAMEMLMGTWGGDEVIEIEDVSAVQIRTRRRRVQVMIDGEVRMFSSPLSFRIRPQALAVLAPPLTEPAVDADIADEGMPLPATGTGL